MSNGLTSETPVLVERRAEQRLFGSFAASVAQTVSSPTSTATAGSAESTSPFRWVRQDPNELRRLGVFAEPILGEPAVQTKKKSKKRSGNFRRQAEALIDNPNTSAEVINSLRDHHSWRVRMAVAGDKRASQITLEILANDLHSRVHIRLLRNPNLAVAQLAQLCRSNNRVVKQLGVAHRSLPMASLLELHDDPAVKRVQVEASHRLLFEVRNPANAPILLNREVHCLEFLCQAPVLSSAFQKGLIDQGSRRIHRALASRADLGAAEVAHLARSRDRVTRVRIASREDLSEDAATILLADDSISVQAAAALRHGHCLSVSKNTPVALARAVAKNPKTPSQKLEQLAGHWHWSVAEAVALHPNVSSRTITELLSKTEWPAVQAAAARSPQVASACRLLRNLTTLSELQWFELAGNPKTPQRLLLVLSKVSDPFIRGRTFGNPSMPLELLQAVALDPQTPAWVQRLLANNETLTQATRDELLTLLAIGAHGPGDPNFDPETCRGNPSLDRTIPQDQSFLRLSEMPDALKHPLWRVRQFALVGKIGEPHISLAATDPRFEVRNELSGFKPLSANVQSILAFDPVDSIAVRYEASGNMMGTKAAPKAVTPAPSVVAPPRATTNPNFTFDKPTPSYMKTKSSIWSSMPSGTYWIALPIIRGVIYLVNHSPRR
jgi:hypothetical protein